MIQLKKVCFAVAFVALIGFVQAQTNPSFSINNTKINQLLRLIDEQYVDTVSFTNLIEDGIVEILKQLDPHSIYIPPKEVAAMNEPLQGGFDGIGVTFQIIKDTINVMEVLIGGPSEKVGLLAGDKIVKVDTAVATGKMVNNNWVQTHLRGEKGTKVKIFVKRGRLSEILEFVITRDKIPMHSINVYFMVDDETGYIRLERFAKDSEDEFKTALTKLKARGMKNLIFDLRGNGGGYLDVAFKIANQFLSKDELIVYTSNFRGDRQEFKATGVGDFKKGKLIVLTDENSASASEIVSGALQDWDRGLIVGRRTFGKGLVQRPYRLVDKAEVRLTVSHYYTPSGRCIQKPYNDGLESYYQDLNNRYRHGEYLTADSIKFPDSLKYYTHNKRVVYAGGGIMPDIFIPYDTSKYSTLYNELLRKAVFSAFALDYMEQHKTEFQTKYPNIENYKNQFEVSDELYKELMIYAKKQGVKDSIPLHLSSHLAMFVKEMRTTIDSLYPDVRNFENDSELEKLLKDYVLNSYKVSVKLRNETKAADFIKEFLKFEIARHLFSYGEAYQIFLLNDDTFNQAAKLIKEEKIFRKFKLSN